MPGNSICDSLDKLGAIFSDPSLDAKEFAEAVDRFSDLSWGIAEAGRVVEIALSAADHPSSSPSSRGRALLVAARAKRMQSKHADALTILARARGDFKTGKDPHGIATCDLGNGAIQAERGKPSIALKCYLRAERAFRESGDLKGVATCVYNRGLIHFQRTEPEDALQCYLLAEKTFVELGQTLQATVCRMNVGIVHNLSGRYQEALDIFVKARESFDVLGDRDRSARCKLNAGNAFAGSERHKQAIAMFSDAQAVFHDLGNERLEAACRLNMAISLVELGKKADAEANLLQALDIFQRIEDFSGMGECRLLSARITGSAQAASEAVDCFNRVGEKLDAASAYAVWAKNATESTAEAYWLQAMKSIEKALVAKRGHDLTSVVSERFFEVGPALVSYALSRGDLTAARRVAEQSDYEHRDRLSTRAPLHVRFLCDKDKLHCLICRGEAIHAKTTLVNRERLHSLATTVTKGLAQPGNDCGSERVELYRQLIEPILDELPRGAQINLSSDFTLGLIPFGALGASEDKYMIQEYPVTMGPHAAREGVLPTSCLAVGKSRFQAPLPPLPATERELDSIQGLFPNVERLPEEAATVSEVKRRLEGAHLVHIATHGIDNRRNPAASALLFEPDADHPSGNLYARDISKIKMKAKLVVLSACETAAGRNSLAQAFLDAGAACVVASAWRVLDEAALLWMQAFYGSYFADGKSVEAHRSACKRLIDSEFSRPHYWASWKVLC